MTSEHSSSSSLLKPKAESGGVGEREALPGPELVYTVKDGAKSFSVSAGCEQLAVRQYAQAQAPAGRRVIVREIEARPGAWSVSVQQENKSGYVTRIVQVT